MQWICGLILGVIMILLVDFGRNFLKLPNLTLPETSDLGRGFREFDNAIINPRGEISVKGQLFPSVDLYPCEFVTRKWLVATWCNHALLSRFTTCRKQWGSIRTYDRVVSVGNSNSNAYYHFVADALMGLLELWEKVSTDDSLYVHAGHRHAWSAAWFDLLGIPPQRVVDGLVFAKRVYVGDPGPCGDVAPRPWKLLHQLVLRALSGSKLLGTLVGKSGATERIGDGTILLVRRDKPPRVVANFNDLFNGFQDKWGERVTLHSTHPMLPLRRQLELFRDADLIVAPHGAGLVLMVSSRPGGSLLELTFPFYINTCFRTLARRSKLRYRSLALSDTNPPTANVTTVLSLAEGMIAG